MQKLDIPQAPPSFAMLRWRELRVARRRTVLQALIAGAVLGLGATALQPNSELFERIGGPGCVLLCWFVVWVLKLTEDLKDFKPASPETCLRLEPLLGQPQLQAYVSKVRAQGRLLTEAEARDLEFAAAYPPGVLPAEAKKRAYQRVHGLQQPAP